MKKSFPLEANPRMSFCTNSLSVIFSVPIFDIKDKFYFRIKKKKKNLFYFLFFNEGKY